MQSHSKEHRLCVSNHPLRTLHRFSRVTQGKKSHTPENSTSECLFQCSENHWVKRIKKITLENPVTSQPRSELKKHLRDQDSLRVALEHVHRVDGRVAEVPQTECRITGGGHHQPLGRVRAAVRQLLVMSCGRWRTQSQ